MSAVERAYCVACTEGSRQLILCLVRSMPRRLILATAFVALSVTVAFGGPRFQDLHGETVRLPRRELAQIERMLSARHDIHKPIATMILHDDTYAECYSASRQVGSDRFVTSFSIVRRNGTWTVEEGSVRQVKAEPR